MYFFIIYIFLNYEVFNTKVNLTAKIIYQSILSGFLGMALGMSLLLIALQKADAGIVATLSSTSPIMILFLLLDINEENTLLWSMGWNNYSYFWNRINFYLLI